MFRFFWYENPADLNSSIIEYRFRVHIFGGIASQSCAIHALHAAIQNAVEAGDLSVEEAKKVIDSFYADDNLRSFDTTAEAIESITHLIDVLDKFGFDLTKVSSPDVELLKAIDEDHRHPDVKDLHLSDELGNALGIPWSLHDDTFVYQFPNNVNKDKQFTKRALLSTLASNFDPLGHFGFALVPAKVALQKAFRAGCGWDEVLPVDLQAEVQRWITSLVQLGEIRVPRLLSLPYPISVELHTFSDASGSCFAAISFLRTVNSNGQVLVRLISSRNRLAPMKGLTTPRMELSGALLAARLTKMIESELEIKIHCMKFWIDSTAVLGLIRNTTTRYQVFVARRLAEIQDTTRIGDWNFVPSELNVADGITRAVFPEEFEEHPYLIGPTFLHSNPIQAPEEPNPLEQFDPSEELKTQPATAMTTEPELSFAQKHFHKSGTLNRLKLSVAWLKRFITFISSKSTTPTGPITVEELDIAEKTVLKLAQRDAYPEVFQRLEQGLRVTERHVLAKYDPRIVDGLLRLGGRLQYSPDISYETRHPLVLPPNGHVTHLYINEIHEKLKHASVKNTFNRLLSRFWFPKINQTVKTILNRCLVCRRRDGRLQVQMMANLPASRTAVDHGPFEVSGADLFGPYDVKVARSTHKRWVALFCCHSSRAVHLEPVFFLEADSFINAVRRFQARRGHIRVLNLDSATNNRSSDKQLTEAINEWNLSELGRKLRQEGIGFHFNPPKASHFGGVFESLIRITRRPLTLALEEQRLTDETLLTTLAEVEAVINSRPLTPVSDDPDDLRALTPADLLVVRPAWHLHQS